MPIELVYLTLSIIATSMAAGFFIHFIVYHFFIKKQVSQLQDRLPVIINGKISQLLEKDFDIQDKINDPALIQKAMPTIEKHIDDFIDVKLAAEIPMLSMFVGGKTTDKIKSVFISNVEILLPQVLAQFASELVAPEKILASIQKPIQHMIDNTTENIQQSIKNKMLLLGILSGFIIGLLNALVAFLY